MKRKPEIPNPEKDRKPNQKKILTNHEFLADSEELKIFIKKKVMNFFTTNETARRSCRELEEEILEREGSINCPIIELYESGLLDYEKGHHKFSEISVKKYFLLTEKNRTQLQLFSHDR